MSFDNNTRRRHILTKYSLYVVVAYSITQVATLIAHLYGFSSVTGREILFTAMAAIGSSLAFLVIIKLKKTMTTKFTSAVFFGHFLVWLILYVAWLLTLREIRVMALFCALMALMFLLSKARLIQSIAITVSVTIIQIAGSYYAIFYLHQRGSFGLEVFYTSCFIPSALFVCGLSHQFSKQRLELKDAKLLAEKNRDALLNEMKRTQEINAELQKALLRIETLANHDELTGLNNRRFIMEMLGIQKSRSDRTGETFSIIMLDIDNFKQINDKYGHTGGDRVLQEVAGVVQSAMRTTDISARYGGEEFLLVLGEANEETALICAERLRRMIESIVFSGFEAEFVVTASLGLTEYRRKEDLLQTITRADTALYRAKNLGRNRTAGHVETDIDHQR